jgi:ribosomal protein S18 acetylase RimI-like enzyme
MNLSFRDMAIDDIAKLTWAGDELHLDYMRHAFHRVDEGKTELVLGEVDGEIVVKGGIDYEKYPGYATIWMVNVRLEYQRKGIGTLFFKELERRALLKGIMTARLHVEKSNPDAEKLYLSLGYEIIGPVTESWNEKDEQGNIIEYIANCDLMEKDLSK